MEKSEVNTILDRYGINRDDKFRYMLLNRMQSDCEYYLGNGNRCARHLWANNEAEHIKVMLALWHSLPVVPEWLPLERIYEYAEKMSPGIPSYGITIMNVCSKRAKGAWCHGLDGANFQQSCELTYRQIRFCELQYQMFLRRGKLPRYIVDEWVRKGFIPHIISVEKVCLDFPPPQIGPQGTTTIPIDAMNFKFKRQGTSSKSPCPIKPLKFNHE